MDTGVHIIWTRSTMVGFQCAMLGYCVGEKCMLDPETASLCLFIQDIRISTSTTTVNTYTINYIIISGVLFPLFIVIHVSCNSLYEKETWKAIYKRYYLRKYSNGNLRK